MKKLLLLTIGTGLTFGAFAQRTATVSAKNITAPAIKDNSAARTTAYGSTYEISHITTADTLALYIVGTNADSGYCAGMDIYGDQSYAERYDFNGADSSVSVTGVVALFGGTISPASTKTISFDVWSVGAQSAGPRATMFNSGLPNTVLTSITNPLTSVITDSVQTHMFTTPAGNLATFFVGCTINYTSFAGDTIGLYSSTDGERTSAPYTVSGADTIANNVNVTQYSDNTWHDNATDNFGLYYNYFLFPIVVINGPVSVSGVTRNNLTFYGNYPNPAVNSTNIKISLANPTDVTITITDATGRTVNTINQTNLSVGTHIIPVSTANMPAGDYIYLVRTAAGDGMASKLTVIK